MVLEGCIWLATAESGNFEMRLTFKDGQSFECGNPVGVYEHVGALFIATIGDDMRLVVDLASVTDGLHRARIITQNDEGLREERATLRRSEWH